MDGDLSNEIERELFGLFRRNFAIHVTTQASQCDLDRSTYGILCLLHDEGAMRMGQIAAEFRLDPSTITRQVRAILDLGLAKTERDLHDRRATLVHITVEGRAALAASRTFRRGAVSQILSSWDASQREEFHEALARFNKAVGHWLAHQSDQRWT